MSSRGTVRARRAQFWRSICAWRWLSRFGALAARYSRGLVQNTRNGFTYMLVRRPFCKRSHYMRSFEKKFGHDRIYARLRRDGLVCSVYTLAHTLVQPNALLLEQVRAFTHKGTLNTRPAVNTIYETITRAYAHASGVPPNCRLSRQCRQIPQYRGNSSRCRATRGTGSAALADGSTTVTVVVTAARAAT